MKKKTTSKPKSGSARETASTAVKAVPKSATSKSAKAPPAKGQAAKAKPVKSKAATATKTASSRSPDPKKSAASKSVHSKAPSKSAAKSSGKASSKTASKSKVNDNANGNAGGKVNGKAKSASAPKAVAASALKFKPPVIPAPMEEPLPKVVAETVPRDDEAGLRNVMASLTSIFGGRDFLSDADLDAFLDSKIASGEIPPSAALDPLDEAQSLVYEAWNSEGPQRVRLARRALETCPDCADAYVILAEEDSKDRKHALELFRKGVEAGERSLDPSLFQTKAGKFWDIMETRPYMRARLGLAECLWESGKKDEAVTHLRELFRLNPSDNQGVRYILAQCLLETGAEGELGELLERFRDDTSPEIRYSHALWAFRREGPGRKASAVLAEAVKSNPHVPAYLLKRKQPPKEGPVSAEAGSDEEAAAYAIGATESWHKTLGAVDWLAEHAG